MECHLGARLGGRTRTVLAFTLIELLIVVAIIAILALVALPNFLEAQVRAKTSRVRADMRTLATALEGYRTDNGNYPIALEGEPIDLELAPITTPIAYITTLPKEPFRKHDGPWSTGRGWSGYDFVRYQYDTWATLLVTGDRHSAMNSDWAVVSGGPDILQEAYYTNLDIPGFSFSLWSYDPTNGTVSRGDIYRTGGG